MASLPIGKVWRIAVAVIAAAGALIPRRRRKKRRKDRDEEPTVDRTVDHTPNGV
jgi:hypothetical protein